MQKKWRLIGKKTTALALSLSFFMTGIATGGLPKADAREEWGVTPTVSFTDIKGHWAAKDITNAAKSGMIQGYPDGTFRPEQTITQEQFLTLVERIIPKFPGHEPDAFIQETYLAEAKGRWSEKTYRHLVAAGIMPTGKPAEGLNRLEAARVLLAALGHQSEGEKYRGTKSVFFSDLSIANADQVMTVYPAYKMGIMAGYPDGTFRPQESISRAQAVVLLTRLDHKIEELFPGNVTDDEKKGMTQAVSSFVREVMDQQRIRRFDDLQTYVNNKKLPASESFLREHFSFMQYEVYDYIRFPRFNELMYFAKIGNSKYRMTVQYYAGELGGSIDKTFYLSSRDGKTFQMIGKDE
ncbi:S-layer homology domain-containing protein [uncultured Brevibacillus sp.]|uniref:S-layer homology domain-containing protein n=1 Tax=uncultured Brevibacillus sp. TaxID=169970 RepID=UPI002595E389|nr:S-layer homology domain-containing protein [uncultured Brevibacillus sp.]